MRNVAGALVLGALLPLVAGCTHLHRPAREAAIEPEAPDEFTPAHFAAAILFHTNRVRHEYHLRALKSLPALDLAADDQARYMALQLTAQHRNAFFGEETPADRLRRRGVRGKATAENVASIPVWPTAEPRTASEIAAALVEAWMNSPGHRANLLNPTYTHLGASVRIAQGAGAWYAYGVQDFVDFGTPLFP